VSRSFSQLAIHDRNLTPEGASLVSRFSVWCSVSRVPGVGCGFRCLRFGVWGSGFGVWGLEFEVWGSGSRVKGSVSRLFGLGFGFGVWGLGFGVLGSVSRLWGFVFRVSSFVLRGCRPESRRERPGPAPGWSRSRSAPPEISSLQSPNTTLINHS
jgi:hypothetical protein